jgi:hypothetical protein
MAIRRDECSELLTLSPQSLDVRLQAVEQSVAAFKRQIDDMGVDVAYVKKYNSIRNEVVKDMRAAINAQQTSLEGIETRLAAALERAVEKSWVELYRLQKNAALSQHDWHTAVTKDFQDAHSRIEAQVKSLREKTQDATAATRKMIEKGIFKMDALSVNMLNRLNDLTEQHEAVQLALQDVVARQKDVKRASQKMFGRVSDASVVTAVPDVDVASERSTEPPFSSESSRRGHRHRQSSSDEASGLDEQSQNVQRQPKVLTSKFYKSQQAGRQLQQCRDRSSSRESSQLHKRMNHMSSRIRNAQASATHVHKSVTELESRQEFQESLSSAVVQELVCVLKWGLQKNQDEQVHGVTQEQIAARALLWQMLSNHEKRLAPA